VRRPIGVAALTLAAVGAHAGPVNQSVNGWNIVALNVVNRLNFSALNGDEVRFNNVIAEGATVQGLEDLDEGPKVRGLTVKSTQLFLSKCQISGIDNVSSDRVTMRMRCVGGKEAGVDYLLVEGDSARISKIDFRLGAPPRININQVVKDD